MVSSILNKFRNWIPIFGIFALLVMFLKLPEAPNIFGIFKCKICASNSPYFPLIGGAYFSVLIAAALLFPNFPPTQIARGGLIWALLLLASLTYINLPNWCVPCLLGHLCNVIIWAIWTFVPVKTRTSPTSSMKERAFLTLFAPLVVMALFSSLNLTLLIYGLKQKHNGLTTVLKPGDSVPLFTATTNNGNLIIRDGTQTESIVIINFIAPDCPFCKEQLTVLSNLVTPLKSGSFQLINVSPALTPDLIRQMPSVDWVEDKEGSLRTLFKVEGYPTLFVVGNNSTITHVVSGVSDQLKTTLSGFIGAASATSSP
jgi:thiol-disulfide isomerase/thioredoxin